MVSRQVIDELLNTAAEAMSKSAELDPTTMRALTAAAVTGAGSAGLAAMQAPPGQRGRRALRAGLGGAAVGGGLGLAVPSLMSAIQGRGDPSMVAKLQNQAEQSVGPGPAVLSAGLNLANPSAPSTAHTLGQSLKGRLGTWATTAAGGAAGHKLGGVLRDRTAAANIPSSGSLGGNTASSLAASLQGTLKHPNSKFELGSRLRSIANLTDAKFPEQLGPLRPGDLTRPRRSILFQGRSIGPGEASEAREALRAGWQNAPIGQRLRSGVGPAALGAALGHGLGDIGHAYFGGN